jgi:hypothetical protein
MFVGVRFVRGKVLRPLVTASHAELGRIGREPESLNLCLTDRKARFVDGKRRYTVTLNAS